MFEIKEPTKLTVKLFGKAYEFHAPTMRAMKAIRERVGAAGNEQAFEIWVEWLESLGIAKESLDKLEFKHLMSLIDYVTGASKN